MSDRNINIHFSSNLRWYSRPSDTTCNCINNFPKLEVIWRLRDKITVIILGLKTANWLFPPPPPPGIHNCASRWWPLAWKMKRSCENWHSLNENKYQFMLMFRKKKKKVLQSEKVKWSGERRWLAGGKIIAYWNFIACYL